MLEKLAKDLMNLPANHSQTAKMGLSVSQQEVSVSQALDIFVKLKMLKLVLAKLAKDLMNLLVSHSHYVKTGSYVNQQEVSASQALVIYVFKFKLSHNVSKQT